MEFNNRSKTKVEIQKPEKKELTKGGFTNRIKIADSQSKQKLMEYGFTNAVKYRLYYGKMVELDISFNIIVDAETLEITGIDVLDEDFLQPYDYQSMIMSNGGTVFARNVYHNVNNILSKLQADGIITGFEKGMYV